MQIFPQMHSIFEVLWSVKFVTLKSVQLGISCSPPLGIPWGCLSVVILVACVGYLLTEITNRVAIPLCPDCRLPGRQTVSPVSHQHFSLVVNRTFPVVTGQTRIIILEKYISGMRRDVSSVMFIASSLGVSGLATSYPFVRVTLSELISFRYNPAALCYTDIWLIFLVASRSGVFFINILICKLCRAVTNGDCCYHRERGDFPINNSDWLYFVFYDLPVQGNTRFCSHPLPRSKHLTVCHIKFNIFFFI